MRALQEWLTASGWDAYIAGWQLACGWTEEFMRPKVHPLQMTDYSVPALRAWRRYLSEKYISVGALNTAWGSGYPSMEDVPVPSPALRNYIPENSDTRPAPCADYNAFVSHETAWALIRLAHAAKAVTGGKRVIGAFYGYAGTRFGHDAIDEVLSCGDVDFLASPFTYTTLRAPGTEWTLNGAIGSCRLHGKAWFVESNVRTHLSRPISAAFPKAVPSGNTQYDGPIWYGPDSEEMSLHQMKKAFAKVIVSRAAMWWFDMWGGWYDTPAYMDFIGASIAFYAEQSALQPVARTAIVFDYTVHERYPSVPGIGEILDATAHTGAAWELFSLGDFERLEPREWRAVIFAGVRRAIPGLELWRGDGRSLIFVSGGDGAAESGRVSRLAEGTVCVHDDHQEYRFDTVPAAETLREALLVAGVHVYAYTGDIVYAFGTMVAVHAAADGEKRLYLPECTALQDVFTGERPEPCEHFTDFTMKKGETRVFRIIKAPCLAEKEA